MDVPLSTNLIKRVADLLNQVEFDDIPDNFETALDELIENAKATSEKIKLKETSTECVVCPVTVQSDVSPCDVQTERSVLHRCRRMSVRVKRFNLEAYASPCDVQTERSVCQRISVRVKRLNLKKELGPPVKRCVVSLKRLDMQGYLEIYESNRPVATRPTTMALSTSDSQNDVMVSLSENKINNENGSKGMQRRYTYNDYAVAFNNACSIQ